MQFLVIIEYPGLLPFIEEWGAADEASLRELFLHACETVVGWFADGMWCA